MDKQGQLTTVTRIKLALVENLPASAQFGGTAPVVTARMQGAALGSRGGSAVSMRNIGTNVQATSRIDTDGSIMIELSAERTRLVAAKGGEEGDTWGATEEVNFRTTVRAISGQPMLAGAQQSTSGKESLQTAIVITATLPLGAKAPAKAAVEQKDGPVEVVQVFSLRKAKAAEALKLLQLAVGERPLSVAADERTNQLIIKGTNELQEVVRAILIQLDK
jgi:type II secretory pathway component GspD/PulD (secretin)